MLTVRAVNTCQLPDYYGDNGRMHRSQAVRQVGSATLGHVHAPKDLLQRTREEARPRKRMTPPYGEEVSFSLCGCVQNRTRLRWRQGAWAQRGLAPAWKGEVVHPGEPGSQCAYRARFCRVLPAPSLYKTLQEATRQIELLPNPGPPFIFICDPTCPAYLAA
jgi:hypothetical protein